MADVEEEEAPPLAEDEQNEGAEEDEGDLEGEGEDSEEDQEGEEESEEEEKDLFELLNESEEEDEEQQAMYKEYLEVVKEIDDQNSILRELKAKSTRLMFKKCKTFRDKQEYRRLRACREQEDIHLRALVNRAIQLQNFGAPRRYEGIELEFTEADRCYFYTGIQSPLPGTYSSSCNVCCFSDSDSDSDSGDDLCCT
ncbi:uncharacterized protein [Drosophila takahashii]|uniref:uncharacterized protein n=1 Tax=Drosophila takahashii TaxID=29030 RepID=UPI001CF8B4CE|nr:protein bfr2 [Drosophila takahashii]